MLNRPVWAEHEHAPDCGVRPWPWAVGAVLVLLALTAYRPVAAAPLLYEDAQTVQTTFRWPSDADLTPGRYLMGQSVALDTWRGDGQPWAYHQTNLALHLVNGLLLWFLLRTLGATDWGRLIGIGLLLLHPIQTQAVSYISGRGDLLATTGVLVTCLVWLRNQWDIEDVSLIVVAGIFTMLVKESAVALFVILPVLAWFKGYDWHEWAIPWGALAGMALLGAPMLVVINAASSVDPVRYVAAQCLAVWAYLSLVLWPVGLSIEHDFGTVPWVLPLIALQVSIAVVGVAWIQRRQRPALALSVGWVVAALLPRLIVRMPDLLQEHQAYLPLIGVWIGVALWIGAPRAQKEIAYV